MLLPAAFLAGGLWLGSASGAAACTCVQLTQAEYFAAADLVVEGVVVGMTAPAGGRIAYTVSVDRVHKGEADDIVEVVSAQDSAACGLGMAIGQRWRLNLQHSDGQLYTGSCSGDELLADAAPMPSPAPGGVPDAASSAIGLFFLLGPGLVGLLALVIAWFARVFVR